MAHNRLQILATEIAEEKVRLTLAMLTCIAGLFFVGLAVVFGTILLVVLFWDTHRITLLSVLVGVFALLGGGLLALTIRSFSNKEPPFQVTLAELKKDENAWLTHQDNA